MLNFLSKKSKNHFSEKDILILVKRFYTSSENRRWAFISSVKIKNQSNDHIDLLIESSAPGVVIGPKGFQVKMLAGFLSKAIQKDVKLDVVGNEIFNIK